MEPDIQIWDVGSPLLLLYAYFTEISVYSAILSREFLAFLLHEMCV